MDCEMRAYDMLSERTTEGVHRATDRAGVAFERFLQAKDRFQVELDAAHHATAQLAQATAEVQREDDANGGDAGGEGEDDNITLQHDESDTGGGSNNNNNNNNSQSSGENPDQEHDASEADDDDDDWHGPLNPQLPGDWSAEDQAWVNNNNG